jgi:hypothetical protein
MYECDDDHDDDEDSNAAAIAYVVLVVVTIDDGIDIDIDIDIGRELLDRYVEDDIVDEDDGDDVVLLAMAMIDRVDVGIVLLDGMVENALACITVVMDVVGATTASTTTTTTTTTMEIVDVDPLDDVILPLVIAACRFTLYYAGGGRVRGRRDRVLLVRGW